MRFLTPVQQPFVHPGSTALARPGLLAPAHWIAMSLWTMATLTFSSVASAQAATSTAVQKPAPVRAWMAVGQRRFGITLADTAAARAFAAAMPLSLEMAELNGNEKHADLRDPLPTSTIRPGTIRSGDLLLYGSRTVVVFYAPLESTYSYTRLGRVDDQEDLAQALGAQGVRVTFSRQ
jgi:hypothetical protein